jgi:sec-independent protein translocase protein TatA
MGNFGAWEIALVVLVILLVFGPKRLPGIGRSLGKGMREFKDSVGETAKELKEATADTPAALKDGFNPKKSLKDALNPFAEDEKPEEEVLEGEIVQPVPPAEGAPVTAASAATVPVASAASDAPLHAEPAAEAAPAPAEEPEPAASERV